MCWARLGAPPAFVKAIRNMLADNWRTVACAYGMTDRLAVERGLPQGCPLSC